jgi:energy-converting hydrogenase A subunit R
MSTRQFCTDSEGPLCLNDNAFELTKLFVPHGDKLFATLSAYDDYLVDIAKRPDYRAGDTLRLILPFLKAYGATNQAIEDYSRQAVNWVPQAREALEYIKDRMEVFIITTSYEQFARPMYRDMGIPADNIYCTSLNLDDYHIGTEETKRLKKLAEEIAAMPPPEPTEPLSAETRRTVSRLDEIFWQEICGLDCGRLMQSVRVMGGEMKAQAIQDSLQRTGLSPGQVMFVGDSITDVEAFNLVRRAGGLSVSFNGNAYALDKAEIACISTTAYATAALALAFADGGREQVCELADNWSEAALRRADIPADLIRHLFDIPDDSPLVEVITPTNRQRLLNQSQRMRRALRGKQVGMLG